MGNPSSAGSTPRWGFIGAGRMATALIRGMLHAGTATPSSIVASDPLESARTSLAAETGISVVGSNAEVADRSDVLVLAVKPQSMSEVMNALRRSITPEHLVDSIAAG